MSTTPPEVYFVQNGNLPTLDAANKFADSMGATLATTDQLLGAGNLGAQWCDQPGWESDPSPNSGNSFGYFGYSAGGPNVCSNHSWDNNANANGPFKGANVFGVKPPANTPNVLPWNPKLWNNPANVSVTQDALEATLVQAMNSGLWTEVAKAVNVVPPDSLTKESTSLIPLNLGYVKTLGSCEYGTVGSCYPKCANGYHGIAGVCWRNGYAPVSQPNPPSTGFYLVGDFYTRGERLGYSDMGAFKCNGCKENYQQEKPCWCNPQCQPDEDDETIAGLHACYTKCKPHFSPGGSPPISCYRDSCEDGDTQVVKTCLPPCPTGYQHNPGDLTGMCWGCPPPKVAAYGACYDPGDDKGISYTRTLTNIGKCNADQDTDAPINTCYLGTASGGIASVTGLETLTLTGSKSVNDCANKSISFYMSGTAAVDLNLTFGFRICTGLFAIPPKDGVSCDSYPGFATQNFTHKIPANMDVVMVVDAPYTTTPEGTASVDLSKATVQIPSLKFQTIDFTLLDKLFDSEIKPYIKKQIDETAAELFAETTVADPIFVAAMDIFTRTIVYPLIDDVKKAIESFVTSLVQQLVPEHLSIPLPVDHLPQSTYSVQLSACGSP